MNTNRLVLCVAAAGLLLSGCSSQSDSDAAESTSAATSTTVAATSSSTAPSSLPELPTSPLAAPAEAAPSVVESTPPAVSLPVAPPANAPIDARSPEEIVANAGEKGQRYIAALRLAGIPPAGMDSAEILYADGTCKALADGMARSD
ncbi:MAG: dihydrofolate reductase, partial [Rhodococcus sp. (in: high G+C Gram-positive bacteria)]